MLPGESVEEYHERIRSPELAAAMEEGREIVLRRELQLLRGESGPLEPAGEKSELPVERWEPRREEPGRALSRSQKKRRRRKRARAARQAEESAALSGRSGDKVNAYSAAD